jgi:PBP1b-binding outer membrane lipoprotein LpoB
MKTAKVLGLILGVVFLAGCASTKCECKKAAAEPVAVAPLAAPIVAPTVPVAAPAPVPVQEEPEMQKVPAAVRK